VVSLYDEDYPLWEYLQQWRVPTREITPDTPDNPLPIPMGYLNGLGALQTQHSCILLIDVTEHCNLNCPTCFAASGTNVGRYARLPHILRSLDTAIEREGGKIDVLMLSGGEPTVHPDIVEIIREATARNVTRVLLNTNGVRIAKDDRFLEALADLRGRVEVYLQFDGFELDTHLFHRGEDLRAVKERAIGRLTDAGIFTTLVMVVAAGVNDHEIGRVAQYAFDTDYIGGVAYQPVFGSGRANAIDPLSRATTTGVLKRLGPQTDGLASATDFIGLPCSHPDCCAIGYFVKGDSGGFRSVVDMVGVDRLKANLGLVSNRIAPDSGLWDSVLGMMSETTTISRPEMIDYLINICEACDLSLTSFLRSFGDLVAKRGRGEQIEPWELIARRVKRLSVKSFMDAWTLNIERLQQCCVHVGSTNADDNPVRIPFCARQLFGSLRRRTSDGQVSARELVNIGLMEGQA
jgi:uncharacterized radical SAM superfamily Fe-S cluster-containing enzyme